MPCQRSAPRTSDTEKRRSLWFPESQRAPVGTRSPPSRGCTVAHFRPGEDAVTAIPRWVHRAPSSPRAAPCASMSSADSESELLDAARGLRGPRRQGSTGARRLSGHHAADRTCVNWWARCGDSPDQRARLRTIAHITPTPSAVAADQSGRHFLTTRPSCTVHHNQRVGYSLGCF